MKTRVLVVDDTIVFRRLVSEALAGIPGVEVVGTAANGRLALECIAALDPDLVTLDIEMPEMNGIEVLEAIRGAKSKAGVVMLSSLTRRGGQMTIHALELGAFDFLTKPESGTPEANLTDLRSRLLPIVRAFERHCELRAIRDSGLARSAAPAVAAPWPNRPATGLRRAGPPVVLVGSSAGGPPALARLLSALPADLGAPILIVQHMPALFTAALAASLTAKSAIPVKEGKDGDPVLANRAYLAPGGRQMKLGPDPQGGMLLHVTDDPPENNCKPAVDYLFRSAALHFPGRAVAAILTGMGSDGTAGLKMLKRSGCFAIAQDEATCVVFGMPKEAIQAGVVDTVVPLDAMAATITRCVREVVP